MTKVQKIREEVEIAVSRRLNLLNGDYFDLIEEVDGFTNELMDIIDSVQEEPVNVWHDASKEIPTQGSNILMVRKEEEDTNYPPIAGRFRGTNSRFDGRNWGYYNGFCYNEIEPPVKWAYVDELLKLDNPCNIGKDFQESQVKESAEAQHVNETCKENGDSLTQESVSEDLGEYINELSKQFPEVSFAKLSRIAVRVAKWQKSNLWKPADGDDLPEIDREVVVLIKYNAQRNIHDEEYSTYRVGFGHRPNPDGWDGKNIDTNEVTHYTPKLYDKGGWNAPNIVYWLDTRLPYEENKISK